MTRATKILAVAYFVLCFALGWTGAANAEYPNGAIPRAALAHIVTPHGCTLLRRDAAASFNTMRLAGGAAITVNGCDSANRPVARQIYWRAYWCGRGACQNAAVVGTSNHGRGIATDVPLATQLYIARHGYLYGWCKRYHAPGCGPSDASYEPWHHRWTPGVWHQRPDPGASYLYPSLRPGSGGPGQRSRVIAVQRRLHVRADGELGPGTRAALVGFQRRHCLAASGVTTKRTWVALRASRATNRRAVAACAAGRRPQLRARPTTRLPAVRRGPQDGATVPARRR